jgi:hypothetical protein
MGQSSPMRPTAAGRNLVRQIAATHLKSTASQWVAIRVFWPINHETATVRSINKYIRTHIHPSAQSSQALRGATGVGNDGAGFWARRNEASKLSDAETNRGCHEGRIECTARQNQNCGLLIYQ